MRVASWGDSYAYDEQAIKEAVSIVVGDDGMRAKEVIETLRVMFKIDKPAMTHGVDENGNFTFEVNQ